MKHRIKELLIALPVDTAEAKRLFMSQTGISRDKFYRMYSNPDYMFRMDEALRIAHFFSIEPQEIYCKEESVMDIVTKIMNESTSIKSLQNHDLETGQQPSRSAVAKRATSRVRESRA